MFLFISAYIQTAFFICLVSPETMYARDVLVRWRSNTEPDLAGYRIYFGNLSGTYTDWRDAGSVTRTIVSGIPDSGHVFFAMTAYDVYGNESIYSREVNIRSGDGGAFSGPAAFELMDNFPNPFNAGTVIPYFLLRKQPVKIRICDLSGREVQLLVSDVQDGGLHTIQWGGTGASGLRVASGIYLCCMESGGFCQIIRMTVLK